MYRLIFGVALACFFFGLPKRCGAADESLSFGQSASGETYATIQGNHVFCDINGGFVGDPAASISPEGIEIVSTILWGDCNPPPPPYPPPTPYSLNYDLGNLADGQYSVAWMYTTVPPAVTVVTARAVLWVESREVAIFHGSFE